MNSVYRVEFEVEKMEGTQLPEHCEGAFVNVYIGTDNIKKAIDMTEKSLLKDCYKPFRIIAAFELDLEETDCETVEKGCPSNADLQNIRINSDIWYGPFHCYPYEEDIDLNH